MCGICGIVYTDLNRSVDRDLIGRMCGTIVHRGPDEEGAYVKDNVGLGSRRLSIIDLAEGQQPIHNEDETVWVVFNGEIYNFPELTRQLEGRGHHFYTHSDTEVIVHAYEEYDDDLLTHLNGMFAFALWDTRRRRLMLARDRVGKKPLYYAEYDGALIFGSELKCILQYPGFPREMDLDAALHHYLTLQYVPDPWSAFRRINKLPPGHRMVWQDGRIHVDRYWDLSYEPKWELEEAELKGELRKTITEAVRRRLISEVPLGAHLSGGLDSSIVVGLMADMTDHPVKTFSIGFEEEDFSELSFARQVAERFGTEHHEFIMAPDAIDLLPKLVRHFDEPFADPAAIPTWYLAQVTRQHVTVALNGDGADEAFAGYQRYWGDPIADLYRRVPGLLREGLISRVLWALPVRSDKRVENNRIMALRQLTRAARMTHGASVVRWGTYFGEDEKWALYNDDVRQSVTERTSGSLLEESFREALATSRLDRTLYADLHNYLPGALLPKVDRTTMAHSLEVRCPFLDYEVMEFAARLPVHWKLNRRRGKRILREIFTDILPPSVVHRSKAGFAVPLGNWFRGPLYQAARDLLLASDTRLCTYLRRDEMEKIVEDNRRGRADNGKRIWTLLSLEVWLREYRAH